MKFTVVAEYKHSPAEGINVVSRTLVDGLRAKGHEVRVFSPQTLIRDLPALILDRAPTTVFTHGPGVRTVLAGRVLRALSPTRIVWVATRPDLDRLPGWLAGGRTAHDIVSNRVRADLSRAAVDASIVVQPIGIAPERLAASHAPLLWPEIRASGRPIAVHVGHLRRNRGLEHLIATKGAVRERLEIIVQASPYFEPDAGVTDELEAAGIHVERQFVTNIADVYRSADLYLFPAPEEGRGAIDLPLSVLEAVACGLPVVSTPFGALPETLADTPGIYFSEPVHFPSTVADWVDGKLQGRPLKLPERLNAHRLTDIVVELARK